MMIIITVIRFCHFF